MEPALFEKIDKQNIHQMLETFYACISLPVQLLDEKGEVLDRIGPFPEYCDMFKKHLPQNETCEKLHANASQLALSLGETYIFSCHSGLNHIVFPLSSENALLGSIMAGPFLMDKPDSLMLSTVGEKYKISAADLLEMYEAADQIPVLKPSYVTQVSRLLFYMCSGLLTGSQSQFVLNHGKFKQQSAINESIQTYKSSGASLQKGYPYEKEKELITKLKTGDSDSAKALLNDVLGYVFFAEGSNLEIVKTRSIEICSLLSRAAIEGGATSDSVLKINNQFLKSLSNIQTLDDLCYKLQESVDVFAECMFNYIPTKNSETIKKAILYISQNYGSDITLQKTADHVHLNSAYFSTLFKQSTGSSFKEYLNMVRVEESKRLLANTEDPIIDIAMAAGFSDQSYFSKVFRRYTGLTPREYR